MITPDPVLYERMAAPYETPTEGPGLSAEQQCREQATVLPEAA